jgi:hypothetical protein
MEKNEKNVPKCLVIGVFTLGDVLLYEGNLNMLFRIGFFLMEIHGSASCTRI